jgi:hypothetical protein
MMQDEAGDAVEMPRYQCHKKVWALKIADIKLNVPEKPSTGAMITPSEKGYAPFSVDAAYMDKHKPQIGGYYVVYDDGYKSFSPAKAFEEGYTRVPSIRNIAAQAYKAEAMDRMTREAPDETKNKIAD